MKAPSVLLFKGHTIRALWIQSRSDCVKAYREMIGCDNEAIVRRAVEKRILHLLGPKDAAEWIEKYSKENDPEPEPECKYNRY